MDDVERRAAVTGAPRCRPTTRRRLLRAGRLVALVAGLALLTSGCSLWGWGANSSGQLGLGDTATRTSPTVIDADWSAVVAGYGRTAAIRVDGSLWAWGNNPFGELGDGTTTNRSSPTRIGLATTWKSVSVGVNHTVAVRTDGTLWAWGRNTSGELGDGTVVNRLAPVQIGTATTWKSASAGD